MQFQPFIFVSNKHNLPIFPARLFYYFLMFIILYYLIYNLPNIHSNKMYNLVLWCTFANWSISHWSESKLNQVKALQPFYLHIFNYKNTSLHKCKTLNVFNLYIQLSAKKTITFLNKFTVTRSTEPNCLTKLFSGDKVKIDQR